MDINYSISFTIFPSVFFLNDNSITNILNKKTVTKPILPPNDSIGFSVILENTALLIGNTVIKILSVRQEIIMQMKRHFIILMAEKSIFSEMLIIWSNTHIPPNAIIPQVIYMFVLVSTALETSEKYIIIFEIFTPRNFVITGFNAKNKTMYEQTVITEEEALFTDRGNAEVILKLSDFLIFILLPLSIIKTIRFAII